MTDIFLIIPPCNKIRKLRFGKREWLVQTPCAGECQCQQWPLKFSNVLMPLSCASSPLEPGSGSFKLTNIKQGTSIVRGESWERPLSQSSYSGQAIVSQGSVSLALTLQPTSVNPRLPFAASRQLLGAACISRKETLTASWWLSSSLSHNSGNCPAGFSCSCWGSKGLQGSRPDFLPDLSCDGPSKGQWTSLGAMPVVSDGQGLWRFGLKNQYYL